MTIKADSLRRNSRRRSATTKAPRAWGLFPPAARKKDGNRPSLALAPSMALLAYSTLLTFLALAWLAADAGGSQGEEASLVASSMGMAFLMLAASVPAGLVPSLANGKLVEAWKQQGRPVAGIVARLTAGLFSGFLLFVLVWMGSVQVAMESSLRAQEALIQQIRGLAHEQGWLDGTGALAPARRQDWCQSALPLARLAQAQAPAFAEGREIGFLLAASHWDLVHANGCITDSQWLETRQGIYRQARQNPSNSFRLANRLEWLPIAHQIVQANLSILDRTNPTPATLCASQVVQAAGTGWNAGICQARFATDRGATIQDVQAIRAALSAPPN